MSSLSSASSSSAVVPPAQGDDQQNFSLELLRLYYDRLFPYEPMFRWLSYGNDPEGKNHAKVDKDFFLKREWSFTLADDIYIRYNCFRDHKEMKAAMMKRQPHKIDIGAVFNLPPKDHLGVSAAAFKTEQRELVFDIDLTDYDDVRTCCSGAKICNKCWGYMTMAIKVLDPALRTDFGFSDVLYIYSGRRGVHCWVSDKEARELSNEARSAVVEYLGVALGADGAKKTQLTWPAHPSLKRAFDILKPMFDEWIAGDEGQAIFAEGRWQAILKTLPVEALRNRLEGAWSRKSDGSGSAEKWRQIEEGILEYTRVDPNAAKRNKRQHAGELEKWRLELVLTHCYPRLDENVSKMQNHLLKSPFAVHPKTGRVCVPVDPRHADEFDPFAVPTLGSLAAEINAYDAAHPKQCRPCKPKAAASDAMDSDAAAGGEPEEAEEPEEPPVPDVEKTSMAGYMKYFEQAFLSPLYRGLKRQVRDDAEMDAAVMGDF